MNIIIENSQNVKVIMNSFGDEMDLTPSRQKWSDKKKRAKEISKKLRAIKQYKRADRMQMCATYIVAEECQSCGNMHVTYTKLCRDRFCPICNWRLSMRRFATMYTLVESLRNAYPENRWQFVTLTVANCEPEELSSTINEMMRTWNSIASSKTFKEWYAGWARSLEITYNEIDGTVHPHFHILLMCNHGKYGNGYVVMRWQTAIRMKTSYLAQDYKEIKMKTEETDDDIVNTEAIIETYKYSVKSDELQEMPLSVFYDVDEAMKGRRLVAFGGKIKEYAKIMEIEKIDHADDREESEQIISRCTRCGNRDIAEVVGEWAGTGYIWRRQS